MRIVPLSSLKSGYVPLLNVITEPSLNVIVNVVLDIVTSLPPVGASLKDSSDKVAVAPAASDFEEVKLTVSPLPARGLLSSNTVPPFHLTFLNQPFGV